MANGDDFDPNPPGTATAMGIGPNDPLVDWASNMKPSDLAQFVHNPQGAVQSMIDQGKPPPDHHYDQLGNPISADQAAQLDAARAAAKQQLAQGLGVPPQQAAPLGLTSQLPQLEGGQPTIPRPPVTPPQATPPPSPAPTLGEPKGPLAPVAKAIAEKAKQLPKFDWTPGGGGEGGAALNPPDQVPTPPARPAPATPPTVKPEPAVVKPAVVPEAVPLPRPRPTEAATPKKAKKEEDEVAPYSSQAVSDFAKSLQGVKIPERPKLPGVQTPGVRSPVGVTPNVQNLLGLAGAPGGLPSAQAAILARLLGRIG